MKLARRIVLALAVLLIVGGIVVYLALNGIVRRAIEVQSTQSLGLQTSLDSARLAVFGGELGLRNLRIASPQDFSAPHILTLDQGAIRVRYRDLRSDPIHIAELVLTRPTIVVEQAGGRFNFQVLLDRPSSPQGEPVRLIIDRLTVNDASVVLRPGIPGLPDSMQQITVPIPSMTLEGIGTGAGNQNGAAIRQVAAQTITALVDRGAATADLPAQMRSALEGAVKRVAAQLESEVSGAVKELRKTIKDLMGEDAGGKPGIDRLLPRNDPATPPGGGSR